MKNTLFALAIGSLSLFTTSCGGDNTTPDTPVADSVATGDQDLPAGDDHGKRYGLKSGMVEYEFSGNYKGKETLYFEDWGWEEMKVNESEMSIMGITQKMHSFSMIDEEWIYNYDNISKQGTRMKNNLLDELTEEQRKDLAEVGMKMMKQMGGEKVGKEDVLGKECEVWEIKNLGSKVWVWNNIVLKTTMKMAGVEYASTAVKIEENADVSDNIRFPDGVDRETFKEMTNPLKEIKK
ncbi:MAG: hypothetical protein IT233_05995 [Bacteroidia bacterium]|nr:hypothetical protein [Bacteroidia bacterium]